MSPPICINIPIHAKVVAKGRGPNLQHHIVVGRWVMIVASCCLWMSRQLKECIKHVSDKEEEEGMKDNGGIY